MSKETVIWLLIVCAVITSTVALACFSYGKIGTGWLLMLAAYLLLFAAYFLHFTRKAKQAQPEQRTESER